MFEYILLGEAIIIALFGLFGTIFAHRSRVSQKKNEARAKVRQQESLLSMRFMSASIKLGIATAIAVQNKDVNGHMDKAMEEARLAEDDYRKLLQEISSEKVSK